MSDHKGNLYHHHPYSAEYAPTHYTHRPNGHASSMSPHMLPPEYAPSHQYTLPNLASHHADSYGYIGGPPMSGPPHGMSQLPPPPLLTNHNRKRRYSDDESSFSAGASTLPSGLSVASTNSYSDAETVHSFMANHMTDPSPLSSSMPPPLSASMGVPLAPSISAPSPSNPPTIVKKSRVNTPWTPAEEHRLKLMRDNGDSWAIIAKSFPNRTEGSVKKHWYKDMHYAEFAEDESQALLSAIREYEANRWKVIGAKVGKPAKACEQYAKDHFTKEQLAPKG